MESLLVCMLVKWLKETQSRWTPSSSHRTITATVFLDVVLLSQEVWDPRHPSGTSALQGSMPCASCGSHTLLLMHHTLIKGLQEAFKGSEVTRRFQESELACYGWMLMSITCIKWTLNREVKQQGTVNNTGTRLLLPQSSVSSFHLARLSHEVSFLLHFPFMTLQIIDSQIQNKQKTSEHLQDLR